MAAGCTDGKLADGLPDTTGETQTTACALCHGNPPAAPHPDNAECFQCHGETVNESGEIDEEGGKHKNGTVEYAASCDSCHGNPPAAPHPDNAECFQCHGETVNESGEIDEDGGKHMNGNQDLRAAATSCGMCHGMPPVDAHPPSENCNKCHRCVVDENQELIPEYEYLHINGNVDMKKPPNCPEE